MSELDSFSCRGESYREGMLLLMDALTKEEWKSASVFPDGLSSIKFRIKVLYKKYSDELNKATTFEAKKNHLSALLSSYNQILSGYTNLSNPFQSLCMAERCAVWKKGREAFSSEFTIAGTQQSASSLKITQIETPYTDGELLSKEFPIKPGEEAPLLWFKLLEPWQGAFIRKYQKQGQCTLAKRSIPSSLRCVPGLANLSLHQCKINGVESLSYFRHATQLPVDLLKKKGTEAENEQFRLSCLNVASQIRLSLDQQLKLECNQGKGLHEAVILSQSILSPGWAADVKSRIFTDPSDDDTRIYEIKEQVIELFQHALAHPNEAINPKDRLITIFFNEEKKIITYGDFLAKFALLDAKKEGDVTTVKYKVYSSVKISLLSTNHPFNVLGRLAVHSSQTKRNIVNTSQLLGAVARYLEPQLSRIEKNCSQSIKNHFHVAAEDVLDDFIVFEKDTGWISIKAKEIFIKKLQKLQSIIELQDLMHLLFRNSGFNKSDKNIIRLLDAVQALLSIPTSRGVLENDRRHHQQLISSAEATILYCIGGTLWVACKSGKDRTGGASAAYDAAAAFYNQRERHPRYEDEKKDRALYVSLLRKYYESGHQQKFAVQNAPGAKGLLGANFFLPGDMKLDAQNTKQETQLARLNKPKPTKKKLLDTFNKQLLEYELQEIKDKIINNELGDDSTTLQDWNRNKEVYFINGTSVNELRKNKSFENKEELSRFIEEKLLFSIEDQNLKQYYQALIQYSFHQGGFPHAFAMINNKLILQFYQQTNFLLTGPDKNIKINFSCLENAIRIEEINTYKQITNSDSSEILSKDDYYCQTHSNISVTLRKAKAKGYQLTTFIDNVNVDVAYQCEQLKPLFFKTPSLLERIINFFVSLKQAVKQYFHPSKAFLDQEWLGKLAASVSSPPSTPQEVQVGEANTACAGLALDGDYQAAEAVTTSHDEKTTVRSNSCQMPDKPVFESFKTGSSLQGSKFFSSSPESCKGSSPKENEAIEPLSKLVK